MQALQELIQSGRIVDVMLVFIALEIVIVSVLRRSRGGGVPALPLFINIGAGGSLRLALRVALTNGGWQTLTACLLAALVFHVVDHVGMSEERNFHDAGIEYHRYVS